MLCVDCFHFCGSFLCLWLTSYCGRPEKRMHRRADRLRAHMLENSLNRCSVVKMRWQNCFLKCRFSKLSLRRNAKLNISFCLSLDDTSLRHVNISTLLLSSICRKRSMQCAVLSETCMSYFCVLQSAISSLPYSRNFVLLDSHCRVTSDNLR